MIVTSNILVHFDESSTQFVTCCEMSRKFWTPPLFVPPVRILFQNIWIPRPLYFRNIWTPMHVINYRRDSEG